MNNVKLDTSRDDVVTYGGEGFQPLTVLAAIVQGHPIRMSMWRPSEDEMQMLLAGGAVALTVLGEGHPGVRLMVASYGAVEEVRARD